MTMGAVVVGSGDPGEMRHEAVVLTYPGSVDVRVEPDRVGPGEGVRLLDRGAQGAITGAVVAHAVAGVGVCCIGRRVDSENTSGSRIDSIWGLDGQ